MLVLPEPLSPTSAMISAGNMSKLTPSRTREGRPSRLRMTERSLTARMDSVTGSDIRCESWTICGTSLTCFRNEPGARSSWSPANGGEVDVAGWVHGTESKVLQTLGVDNHIVDVDKRDDDAGVKIHLPRSLVESVALLDVSQLPGLVHYGIGLRQHPAKKVEGTVFCEEHLCLVRRVSGVRACDREQQIGRVWVVLQGVSGARGQYVSCGLYADQRQLRYHQVGDAAVARVRAMKANDQFDWAMFGDRGFRCLEVGRKPDRIYWVEHHVRINRPRQAC